MTSTHAPPLASLASRCYRLTPRGRACVDVVDTKAQTTGSLSRYLRDVLQMCGTGVWFEQLQQFMPPRSLDESLRSLLELVHRLGRLAAPRGDRKHSGPEDRARRAVVVTVCAGTLAFV